MIEMEKEDTKILQLPATLDKFESLAHGAMKFTFSTQENIKPEYLTFLMNNHNQLGYLNFAVRQIEATDLEKLPEPDRAGHVGKKSLSQRLRAVIWIRHQQAGGTEENFPAYYEKVMEFFINQIKEKLD